MTQLESGSDPRANEKLLELLAMTFHELRVAQKAHSFHWNVNLNKAKLFQVPKLFFHKLIPEQFC